MINDASVIERTPVTRRDVASCQVMSRRNVRIVILTFRNGLLAVVDSKITEVIH